MELPQTWKLYNNKFRGILIFNRIIFLLKTIYKAQFFTMFKTQRSPNRFKENDEDIEHLKFLIEKIKRQYLHNGPIRESGANEHFRNIQEENRELKARVQSLTNQNKKIIRQLLAERQENSQLKESIALKNTKVSPTFEKPQRTLQMQKTIHKLQPSRNTYESELIRPQQSSPSKLITFNQSSNINRDQLYRLNSNLIEYNTNIKLLTEKYNYLHKLRGLNFSNDSEQLKVINQANQIFSNRKSIEQARSILQSSRKKYFGSDSSSDIEEQLNQLEEGS